MCTYIPLKIKLATIEQLNRIYYCLCRAAARIYIRPLTNWNRSDALLSPRYLSIFIEFVVLQVPTYVEIAIFHKSRCSRCCVKFAKKCHTRRFDIRGAVFARFHAYTFFQYKVYVITLLSCKKSASFCVPCICIQMEDNVIF